MNQTTITAIEQVAFAVVGLLITYVAAHVADLGAYGPYVLAGLQATQTVLNSLLGNPATKAIGALFAGKDKTHA